MPRRGFISLGSFEHLNDFAQAEKAGGGLSVRPDPSCLLRAPAQSARQFNNSVVREPGAKPARWLLLDDAEKLVLVAQDDEAVRAFVQHSSHLSAEISNLHFHLSLLAFQGPGFPAFHSLLAFIVPEPLLHLPASRLAG